jgi:hypothetical protein
MSYESEMTDSDRKLGVVLMCSALVIVSLFFLVFTGLVYYSIDKRIKAVNTRITELHNGVTTFHVWNFEKNKMDVYIAAGITKSSPMADDPVLPLYVTQSFFEAGLNKVRQRTIEFADRNKATESK